MKGTALISCRNKKISIINNLDINCKLSLA